MVANPGVADVERRMKANSRNVGVAARHGLFFKKLYVQYLPHDNKLKLTAHLPNFYVSRSFA